MPRLTKTDKHNCFLCSHTFMRKHLKMNLTFPGKKEPRCTALKSVIPFDVWNNQIHPYYTNDAPMPDLGPFKNSTTKSPGKTKMGFKNIKDRRNKKRRMRVEREITDSGKTRLSQAELLELLHHTGNADFRWLVNEIQQHGASEIRKLITHAKRWVKPREMKEIEDFIQNTHLLSPIPSSPTSQPP